MALSKEQAAELILARRRARVSFLEWCKLVNETQPPAHHHTLIIEVLQAMTERQPINTYPVLYALVKKIHPHYDTSKPLRKVMFLMPPGTAKSTYTSKLFPAWYLGKCPGHTILSCSYSKDLVAGFGRNCRNLVEERSLVLGYNLNKDSRAADEWETSNGGRYFCAGVNAGIAGYRADFGLIDDPIGSEQDADSKAFRKTLKLWYINDFIPRLKPDAMQVIIANRRNEMDLNGMLLNSTDDDPHGIVGDASDWVVLRIPFFADQPNDPLGRELGAPIWPEYFNSTFVESVRRLPGRTRAGLYQQKPTVDEGSYFKRDWLIGYKPEDLPPLSQLRIYIGSDHAISKADAANKTCMVAGGLDSNDELWILPHIFWERADSMEQVDAMINMARRYKPITWRAEKGHISKSLLPFLNKRKREEKVYFNVFEYTPKRDKQSRAQSIRGRMGMGMVHFPKFADWWEDAEHDILAFDCGKDDDIVDALAHLGNQLDVMTAPSSEDQVDEQLNVMPELTFKWLKQHMIRKNYEKEAALNT